MLDSYADQAEDAARGHHSYFGHYPNGEEGAERLCAIIERAAERLLSLPDGERHGVLIACIVALYLSKDSVRTPAMRGATRRITRASGPLPWALTPIARASGASAMPSVRLPERPTAPGRSNWLGQDMGQEAPQIPADPSRPRSRETA
jgi:hypothetical protein